ncbi:MAG: pyrroline-5-carboxylate reductase [Steroidobacteraceae bacterium]
MNPGLELRGRLGFMGGGHMARALAGGLIARGIAPGRITIADPLEAARNWNREHLPGVVVTGCNEEAGRSAETWIIAVKPQQVRTIAMELNAVATARRPLVISVAAGIRMADLARWLGDGARIVRCMPNRPALVGAGMTVLCAGPGTTRADQLEAEALLGAVGECAWVQDESLLDGVTAVSGSGPAYVFLLMEMMEAAALAEGIPAELAHQLVGATVHGAAELARQDPRHPSELRHEVTSPGGTTAAALAELEKAGLRTAFLRAIRAASDRSRALSSPGDGPEG